MPDSNKKWVTLDRESNEQTRRLKKSLNKVKWSRSLMQIFWTAGPVTSLGLIGGYYIGYGTMPSIQLLIYFISFTLFSGLMGLLAKVVYDGTRGHLEEQSTRDIRRVTGKLADLILIARDKVVQEYEGEARQREAAMQLLRRVDLTPYGVTIAFSDLTGDRVIGDIMGQIFAYRRIGLQTKVRELYAEHRDKINIVGKSLQERSPEASKELRQWFTGKTSGRLKYGVPREKYFLQRIMSAIEHNNPYIMTFRDVEEMMILAFELISGREIPTLIFTYSGRWKYADRLDHLEKAKSRFRVTQARGGNRIRALASYLVETGIADPEELPEGMEINELAGNVHSVIDRLSARLRDAAAFDNGNGHDANLSKLVEIMDNAIELYRMAHEGYRMSGKRYKELMKAMSKWESVSAGELFESGLLTNQKKSKGIRVKESVISLDEEARVEVCRHLSWYFNKEDIKTRSHTLFSSFSEKGAMSARRLAVEIAVALEPHIQISRPEIQRNINATKAIYLGGLSPEMSAGQKQELGRKMVEEADDGLEIAALRLAETLIWQYQVDLSEKAIDFLHINYGAGRRSLKRIAERKSRPGFETESGKTTPTELGDIRREWIQTLEKSRKRISKRKS